MTGPQALAALLDGTALEVARPTWVIIARDTDMDGNPKFVVLDPFDINYGRIAKDEDTCNALVDEVKTLLMSDLMLHDDWVIHKYPQSNLPDDAV